MDLLELLHSKTCKKKGIKLENTTYIHGYQQFFSPNPFNETTAEASDLLCNLSKWSPINLKQLDAHNSKHNPVKEPHCFCMTDCQGISVILIMHICALHWNETDPNHNVESMISVLLQAREYYSSF